MAKEEPQTTETKEKTKAVFEVKLKEPLAPPTKAQQAPQQP